MTDVVPDTPTVMLTGLRDQSVGELSVSEDAEDFISKADMRPNQLIQVITHSIDRRRQIDEPAIA